MNREIDALVAERDEALKVRDLARESSNRNLEKSRELVNLEHRIAEWVRNRIGADAMHPAERAMRLLEEAIELAQAEGVTAEMAHKQTEHVFSRPAGSRQQEAGGVGVCFAAYCSANGWHLIDVLRAELERIEAKAPEEIRGSLARKGDAGLFVSAVPMPDKTLDLAWQLEQERQQTAELRKQLSERDAEVERLKAGLRSQAIAGTRHWFYAPCAKCGAIEGMGLSSPRSGEVAVWCCYCGAFGPSSPGLSKESDRAAVMAWNAEFHSRFQALQQAERDTKAMAQHILDGEDVGDFDPSPLREYFLEIQGKLAVWIDRTNRTEKRAEEAERELEAERGIVDRIWDIFGRPDYASLKGKSIYDLINEQMDRAARAEDALDDISEALGYNRAAAEITGESLLDRVKDVNQKLQDERTILDYIGYVCHGFVRGTDISQWRVEAPREGIRTLREAVREILADAARKEGAEG